MARLITVAPRGADWVVRAADLNEDLVFQAGSRAEASARALATRTAAEGRNAELRIILRDGSLAGSWLYPSRSAPDALAG